MEHMRPGRDIGFRGRCPIKGSQFQRNIDTSVLPPVQNVVEKVIEKCFRVEGYRPLPTTFTSRTDKGVHALRTAFHVDLPPWRDGKFLEGPEVAKLLNTYFYKGLSIRVLDAIKVPDQFHARRLCGEKLYVYRIGICRKRLSDGHFVSPISECDRTYFARQWEFDSEKAEKATQLFLGEKDFGAILSRPTQNVRSTICNIKSFTIERAEPLMPSLDPFTENFEYYHFKCRGTRFLYHMVRRMVSMVLAAAKNVVTLDNIQEIIEKADPALWDPRIKIVPGHGLYLVNVIFNEGSFSQVEEVKIDKSASDESS